ncbi:MAG TPA: hypothetical protein VF746_18440 [Longimicrobium sp.]|jgi:hypothetical protein
MDDRITDVWFRSALPLAALAEGLRLEDVEEDAEDYWEWVTGTMSGERIDITRTHALPPEATDTRVFLPDGEALPAGLLGELVARLREVVPGPITAGRWEYLRGNDFHHVPVRVYQAAGEQASPGEGGKA